MEEDILIYLSTVMLRFFFSILLPSVTPILSFLFFSITLFINLYTSILLFLLPLFTPKTSFLFYFLITSNLLLSCYSPLCKYINSNNILIKHTNCKINKITLKTFCKHFLYKFTFLDFIYLDNICFSIKYFCKNNPTNILESSNLIRMELN